MRIDLFFCNDLSVKAKRTGNAIGRMLKDTKEFNVNNKTFRNPPDSNSPYYVSGNEIRFFRADAKEREQAQHIRDLIKSKTGLEFDLKEVGMRTPGIISIFMCSN